jgi:hypothetical protein
MDKQKKKKNALFTWQFVKLPIVVLNLLFVGL